MLDEKLVLCRKAAGLRLFIDEALRSGESLSSFQLNPVFLYYKFKAILLHALIFYFPADSSICVPDTIQFFSIDLSSGPSTASARSWRAMHYSSIDLELACFTDSNFRLVIQGT